MSDRCWRTAIGYFVTKFAVSVIERFVRPWHIGRDRTGTRNAEILQDDHRDGAVCPRQPSDPRRLAHRPMDIATGRAVVVQGFDRFARRRLPGARSAAAVRDGSVPAGRNPGDRTVADPRATRGWNGRGAGHPDFAGSGDCGSWPASSSTC